MDTVGDSARIGLIVPTLGRRVDFLLKTLDSIVAQGIGVHGVLVCPSDTAVVAADYGFHYVPDPGGISAAINAGMASLPASVEYVAWLGDDDVLTGRSLITTQAILDRHPKASACFGVCEYIDENGDLVWASRARRVAMVTARFGPNLIPQPGSLIRRLAWDRVGGLDETLRYAMDLDLFLKLGQIGPVLSTRHCVAQFRWHDDSTTVSGRQASLPEAFEIRKANCPAWTRWLVTLGYRPTVWATMAAAGKVQQRSDG